VTPCCASACPCQWLGWWSCMQRKHAEHALAHVLCVSGYMDYIKPPRPGPVAASLPKTDNILLVLCRSVLASCVKCGRPWLRLEKGSGPPP